jgi:sigma-B regulation protein RsbU (phosphoserine phosphatase)/two-component system sensor histidine kinase ChiS
VELPLKPGDWGLLYTDGVSETTNPAGIEFGTDRFNQFLATEQSASSDHCVNGLLEELSRWSARGPSEDLDDDLTLVALHIKGD